jgi:argininosuccinate lyase
MGAAALGTSSFPVDRPRLAALLGFDGVDENSYGADQLAAIDLGGELAGLAATMALTTGSFVQDIHTQYHQSSPWIMLQQGALTGTSSIMPQKRNPYGLNVLRLSASDVLGAATTFLFEAHNLTPGMPDYKREGSQRPLDAAATMFADLNALIGGLVIDPRRALAEVEGDYSTTTELADTLQRVADVPFRVGHHFASALVDYGRAHGLAPAGIPFGEAQRIYTEAAAAFPGSATALPLTEAQFRTSLSAHGMVEASQGLGGPQPAEVARLLKAEQDHLAADEAWLKDRQDALAAAQVALNDAFAKLVQSPK